MLRAQAYARTVVPDASSGRTGPFKEIRTSRSAVPPGETSRDISPQPTFDRGALADFLSQANGDEKLTNAQLHLFDDTAPLESQVRRQGGKKAESRCGLEPIFPPAAPWTGLEADTPATGYLSVYLSEDLSKLPIRAITRPNDNKSDPNIETGTYGLFSTCERGMRAGIVNNKARFIIFLSKRGEGDVLLQGITAWPGKPRGFGMQRSETTPSRPTTSTL